jgi:hypothetical protein
MPKERMMLAVAQDPQLTLQSCFYLGESTVGKEMSWRLSLPRWLFGRRHGLLGLIMAMLLETVSKLVLPCVADNVGMVGERSRS